MTQLMPARNSESDPSRSQENKLGPHSVVTRVEECLEQHESRGSNNSLEIRKRQKTSKRKC